MTRVSSKWILSHSTWYKFRRSGHETAPDFLLPLKDLGVTSVFVFPILLEHRLFAALVCGDSIDTEMASEDIHHAIQVADQLAVAFSNVQLIEAMEQLHWGTLTALARAIDGEVLPHPFPQSLPCQSPLPPNRLHRYGRITGIAVTHAWIASKWL